MLREYVVPAEADVLWADAIIFGVSGRFRESSAEWKGHLDLLKRLASERKLDGKIAGVVCEAEDMSLPATILQLGFTAVPCTSGITVEGATAFGRKVGAIARALKQQP